MTNFNLSDFLRILGTFSAAPTGGDDTVSNESAEPTETSNATSNTTTTETSNTTTNATSNTTPTGLAPDSLSSVEYQDDISGSQRSSCNIEHLISDINGFLRFSSNYKECKYLIVPNSFYPNLPYPPFIRFL